MIVYLNGRFVPEQQALVSVFDRSFLYGDGLFETMLVANGTLFRWDQHLERLERGAAFLGIPLAITGLQLRAATAELLRQNRVLNGILRLTLSRGTGVRGYSPRGADSPFVVMTIHPSQYSKTGALTSWHLRTSSFRLPANEPMAQFKTCNKLAQVLARAQAEQEGADEALLLNTDGFVVEAASANLFWTSQQTLFTPPLAAGVLAGVTRKVIIELCGSLGFEVREMSVPPGKLRQMDGVFLSLSTLGIVQAASLDGHPLRQSPLIELLRTRYFEMVERETATT